jgi:hypothetical protein
MSKISISNLHPAGADLFIDDDSLMVDLKNDELNITGGGGSKSKSKSKSKSSKSGSGKGSGSSSYGYYYPCYPCYPWPPCYW